MTSFSRISPQMGRSRMFHVPDPSSFWTAVYFPPPNSYVRVVLTYKSTSFDLGSRKMGSDGYGNAAMRQKR